MIVILFLNKIIEFLRITYGYYSYFPKTIRKQLKPSNSKISTFFHRQPTLPPLLRVADHLCAIPYRRLSTAESCQPFIYLKPKLIRLICQAPGRLNARRLLASILAGVLTLTVMIHRCMRENLNLEGYFDFEQEQCIFWVGLKKLKKTHTSTFLLVFLIIQEWYLSKTYYSWLKWNIDDWQSRHNSRW